MQKKKTQKIPSHELPQRLAQARGDETLDLLITNVQLLDVITGEIYPTTIAIGGEFIVGVGLEYQNSPPIALTMRKDPTSLQDLLMLICMWSLQ